MSREASEDLHDYPIGDTFVSETRQHRYRTGYLSRRHPRRPSLAHINALPDRKFLDFIRSGRLRSPDPDLRDELDEIRAELRELKAEINMLRHASAKAAPKSSAVRGGGLDVPLRP
jgi:hypothetical protein